MQQIAKKKLYICSTPYHLLYAMVREANNKNLTFLYLSSYDEKIIDYYKEIVSKTNFENFKIIIRKRNRLNDFLYYGLIEDKIEYKKIVIDNNIDELFIFPWNVNNLYIHANHFFKKHDRINFIEDGITASQVPKKNKYYSFFKKRLYGLSTNESYKKVLKIYVNDKKKYIGSNLSNEIIKEEKFEEIFNEVSKNQKEKLFKFFNNYQENNMNESDFKKSVIILTQPLSEDGYETEHNKIEIYREIVKEYISKDYFVYFKRHPRDLSEYVFKDRKRIHELNKFLPAELLSVNNMKFDYAIGVCTSAINNVNATTKINLKPDYFYDNSNKGLKK